MLPRAANVDAVVRAMSQDSGLNSLGRRARAAFRATGCAQIDARSFVEATRRSCVCYLATPLLSSRGPKWTLTTLRSGVPIAGASAGSPRQRPLSFGAEATREVA